MKTPKYKVGDKLVSLTKDKPPILATLLIIDVLMEEYSNDPRVHYLIQSRVGGVYIAPEEEIFKLTPLVEVLYGPLFKW